MKLRKVMIGGTHGTDADNPSLGLAEDSRSNCCVGPRHRRLAVQLLNGYLQPRWAKKGGVSYDLTVSWTIGSLFRRRAIFSIPVCKGEKR